MDIANNKRKISKCTNISAKKDCMLNNDTIPKETSDNTR